MEDSRAAVRPQGTMRPSRLLQEATLSPQRRPSCSGLQISEVCPAVAKRMQNGGPACKQRNVWRAEPNGTGGFIREAHESF